MDGGGSGGSGGSAVVGAQTRGRLQPHQGSAKWGPLSTSRRMSAGGEGAGFICPCLSMATLPPADLPSRFLAKNCLGLV